MAFSVSNRQPPEQVEISETPTIVRVLPATPQSFLPRVTGFGVVEPAQTWTAVAQVAGRVVEVHPAFRRGGAVEAGDVLVRIAPDDYELAIAQAQAEIESIDAELEQSQKTIETINRSLAIERQALALSKRELDRQRDLVERNVAAPSTADDRERTMLAQQVKVQELANQLTLMPTTIKSLKQAQAVAKAAKEIAELNLERTVIDAPFAARVADADVEVRQFVNTGTIMGHLDAVAAAEIEAQISPRQMAGFVRLAVPAIPVSTPSLSADGEPVDDVSDERVWPPPGQVPPNANLRAIVRPGFSGEAGSRLAEVRRISDTVDPETRSIGVIVRVPNPYSDIEPGKRPPLIKGMFVEVELRAPVVDDVFVLPRAAIQNDHIMIVDEASRLALQEVEIVYQFNDIAVLESTLEPGIQVVISDLSPGSPGMLLAPVVDEAAQARLERLAMPGTFEAAARVPLSEP